jgi:polysaccharide export outer membrane protein
MNRAQTITIALLSSIVSVYLGGCGNKFFDPTQIGRFRSTPAVSVILDSLGVAEEAPVPFKDAEEPRPSDIVAVEGDYVFTSGDVVRIAIFELFQEGMTVVSDYVVTETGKISIPDVGVVQAAGLSERQLEDQIKQTLSPGILKAPSVTVTLLNSQQRTFSILGSGVPGSGRYLIPRYDFRLTDALATAGGPAQFNVSYIYVSRRQKSKQESPEVTKPEAGMLDLNRLDTIGPKQGELQTFQPGRTRGQLSAPTGLRSELPTQRGVPGRQDRELRFQSEREMLQMITPQVQRSWPESKKVVIASTEMIRNRELDQVTSPPGFYMLANRTQQALPARGAPNRASWGLTERGTTSDQIGTSYTPSTSARLFGSSLTGQQTSNNEFGGQIEWTFRDGKWVAIQVAPPQLAAPEIKQHVQPGDQVEWTFQDGKWVPVQVTPPKPAEPQAKEAEAGGRIEWIFEDGKWVPVQVGPPKPTKPAIKFEPEGPAVPLEEKLVTEELEWEKAVQTRVIKIPAAKLLAGDPRYNVVIKPGDTIHVPVDIIGEFCIMGNVNSRGYINITGRPMTLKMAIAAAGGLGPLAWPKRCEVIRRIGENKEEIVMVDLDKIANGEQPDFFIKPNDLINVGSHATARWRAVLRNAFRATYGFGFVYDRNFGDADYGKGFRMPHWF